MEKELPTMHGGSLAVAGTQYGLQATPVVVVYYCLGLGLLPKMG